jgi:hypothetical protein
VWVVTLTLLTCLSIDCSNPLLPGVVRFDDRESVYAVRAERSRMDARAATTSLLPAPGARAADHVVTPSRVATVVPERILPVPAAVRPRGRPSAPPAPTPGDGEDH